MTCLVACPLASEIPRRGGATCSASFKKSRTKIPHRRAAVRPRCAFDFRRRHSENRRLVRATVRTSAEQSSQRCARDELLTNDTRPSLDSVCTCSSRDEVNTNGQRGCVNRRSAFLNPRIEFRFPDVSRRICGISTALRGADTPPVHATKDRARRIQHARGRRSPTLAPSLLKGERPRRDLGAPGWSSTHAEVSQWHSSNAL